MRFISLAAITLAVAIACAAPAIQSRADDRDSRDRGATAQCVSTPLRGSRVIDDRTVIVDDWHGNAAVLGLTGPCVDRHTWSVRIRLSPQRDEICRAEDVDSIADSNPGSLGVCAVRSVELLSRADAGQRAPDRGVW